MITIPPMPSGKWMLSSKDGQLGWVIVEPERTDDRTAFLNRIRENILDQAGWAAFADWLLESGDGRGYEVVTGKILTGFDRFEEYEGLRAEGWALTKVGRGSEASIEFVRPTTGVWEEMKKGPSYDPDNDIRWWLLYVDLGDYNLPKCVRCDGKGWEYVGQEPDEDSTDFACANCGRACGGQGHLGPDGEYNCRKRSCPRCVDPKATATPRTAIQG